MMLTRNRSAKGGFTLLELLIVIAIIAILSVVLIFALNPAETLRKSRDVQRISDLNTMKTALTLYATATTSPDLDGQVFNTFCLSSTPTPNLVAKIGYSINNADVACTTNPSEGTDVTAGSTFAADSCQYASASAAVDGTGWIPVDLSTLTGGSPISALPIDPTNTIATITAPTTTDLVYRYACQSNAAGKPATVFELNATLESEAYTVVDDKRVKDGGDNILLYEVGSSLRLLGAPTVGY